MAKRKGVFLAGVLSVSLVLVLTVRPVDDTRPLSEREMATVRGLLDACQDYIIDEDVHEDCLSPYGSADNTCDWLACVTSGGCGDGTHWSNNEIHKYHYTGNYQWAKELKTSGKTCSYGVECDTGAQQATKDCDGGWAVWVDGECVAALVGAGCVAPTPPTVEGCYPCSEGDMDLDSLVTYEDPKDEDCPFESEL